MNQLIAAGGERISQAGAKLNSSYIYASQTYLINWNLETGVESTWKLDSTVTCVASDGEILYAGTQNGTIYVLKGLQSEPEAIKSLQKSITCLYVGELVLVGCSDGFVYDLHNDNSYRPTDRFYPLAVTFNAKFNLIAIAGTSTSIYLVNLSSDAGSSSVYTELPGHENWVRSLDFCQLEQDLVLASAAQDRYIRLWRITKQQYDTNLLSGDLTTTVYQISDDLNCVFDALLIGHDDWVVSVKWQPIGGGSCSRQLLSASSDSSIIIWSSNEAQETDEEMQVWTPTVRLGDVSIMGASTATGATGGFWTSEWFNEHTIATLGRTGSWRIWESTGDSMWASKPAITGHTRAVTGCAWLGDHSLVTTSLDQTTRLWAKLKAPNQGLNAFYELSRPQIHGFDMNCVAVANGQLVSAGDEKILRVFGAPTVYHQLLETHTAAGGSSSLASSNNIAAASVPALGLSNKATDTSEAMDTSVLPQEAELQRLTLWPELEKIYGHGYEIVCCDVSPNGQLVASCCRANSSRHAVVRIYTCDKWRQLEPLSGEHTLTITRVRFSPDSQQLLSVSRDRQWSLFNLQEMKLRTSKPKAHSRIIWDCCWLTNETFLTVSRDKSVKVWNTEGDCIASANFDTAVTACDAFGGKIFIGLEDGQVLELDTDLKVKQKLLAEGRINQLALREYLAVASDTVRIFSVEGLNR